MRAKNSTDTLVKIWMEGERGIFPASLQAWRGCVLLKRQRARAPWHRKGRPPAVSSPQPHRGWCGITQLGAGFLCIARGSLCMRYWSEVIMEARYQSPPIGFSQANKQTILTLKKSESWIYQTVIKEIFKGQKVPFQQNTMKSEQDRQV